VICAPERDPEAQVISSSTLDSLLLKPGKGTTTHALREALRPLGLPFRRTAAGLQVSAHHAPKLLLSTGIRLEWTEEAKTFAENRRQVLDAHSEAHSELMRIKSGGASYARTLVPDLHDIDRLDPHQVVNVAAMTTPRSPGLCIFDEQGAGKTVTVIFGFDLLVSRDEVDMALIVAPKSMVAEWPADIHRFKGDLYRVEVLSGKRSEKFLTLTKAADVYVTNFETTVSMERELRALLRSRNRRAILVVDESFFIKNVDAKRTVALRRLREWCGRAYVLCGTPAPNAPRDLVEQFGLVDFGFTFAGSEIPDEPEQAGALVQSAIDARGLYIRHLKQDVLPDLPGKTFHQVRVRLEPQQKQAYQGALESYVADLRAASEREFERRLPSFLARRMALLQICSNPSHLVPGYSETPAKLLALDALIYELVETRQEKVVIWSFFRASIDAIIDRYAALAPLRYDGSVSDIAQRREVVDSFQNRNESRLLVANPAAAGAGLTLHRARYAIYESLSNQAAHYLQSIDRIHRRGQERPVEYVVLLCQDTIDIAEYQRLCAKERAEQELLADTIQPPLTRQLLLSEVLSAG
jgi:SNF2 family DNA or RNA helicase